jgi:hypothetical protein
VYLKPTGLAPFNFTRGFAELSEAKSSISICSWFIFIRLCYYFLKDSCSRYARVMAIDLNQKYDFDFRMKVNFRISLSLEIQ